MRKSAKRHNLNTFMVYNRKEFQFKKGLYRNERIYRKGQTGLSGIQKQVPCNLAENQTLV